MSGQARRHRWCCAVAALTITVAVGLAGCDGGAQPSPAGSTSGAGSGAAGGSPPLERHHSVTTETGGQDVDNGPGGLTDGGQRSSVLVNGPQLGSHFSGEGGGSWAPDQMATLTLVTAFPASPTTTFSSQPQFYRSDHIATATVTDIALQPDSPAFTLRNPTCPALLAPSQEPVCQIVIQFDPSRIDQSDQSVSATLTFSLQETCAIKDSVCSAADGSVVRWQNTIQLQGFRDCAVPENPSRGQCADREVESQVSESVPASESTPSGENAEASATTTPDM